MTYWNNTVTVYRRGQTGMERLDTFDGCFWMRKVHYVYDKGRKRSLNAFVCRLPVTVALEAGDLLILGDERGEIADVRAYLEEHRSSAFLLSRMTAGVRMRCEGYNA